MKLDMLENAPHKHGSQDHPKKKPSGNLLPQQSSESIAQAEAQAVLSITRSDGRRVLTIERVWTITKEHEMNKQIGTCFQESYRHPREICITDVDMERLEKVISVAEPSLNLAMLQEELDGATVVSSKHISPDVVTMNSQIRFQDLATEGEFEVILSYPSKTGPTGGRVSVLAPVGAALLGLKVGDEIEWPLPSGKRRFLKVSAVPFQPEAAGQYHL